MKYREPKITSPYIFHGWSLPTSAQIEVKQMDGLGIYIKWIDCPTGENILAAGFTNKNQAKEYARAQNWTVHERQKEWTQPAMM